MLCLHVSQWVKYLSLKVFFVFFFTQGRFSLFCIVCFVRVKHNLYPTVSRTFHIPSGWGSGQVGSFVDVGGQTRADHFFYFISVGCSFNVTAFRFKDHFIPFLNVTRPCVPYDKQLLCWLSQCWKRGREVSLKCEARWANPASPGRWRSPVRGICGEMAPPSGINRRYWQQLFVFTFDSYSMFKNKWFQLPAA